VPLLLPFDEADDEKLYAEMNKATAGRLPILRAVRSPQAMLARIERLHGVVTMRYHGAIFAAMAGIAPLLVSYDPKVAALSEILELPAAIPVDRLTVDRLVASWEQCEAKRDYYATRMPLIRQNQQAKARENIALLCRHVPSLAGQAGVGQSGK
jgi:polysaccharide pyruvyl transferase WcaK-like protein